MGRRRTPGLTVVVLLLGVLAGCGDAAGPPSAQQQARARADGFDANLVYVTEVDGFHSVVGGTGVYGDSSYQVIYSSSQGDLRLTIDPDPLTAQTCPGLPIPAAEPGGAPVTCTPDADGWLRTSGDRHEYAQTRDGVLIRASAPSAVPAKTLRSAVTQARRATPSELDEILPPLPDEPVQRGDISGDNAPDNSGGAGG